MTEFEHEHKLNLCSQSIGLAHPGHLAAPRLISHFALTAPACGINRELWTCLKYGLLADRTLVLTRSRFKDSSGTGSDCGHISRHAAPSSKQVLLLVEPALLHHIRVLQDTEPKLISRKLGGSDHKAESFGDCIPGNFECSPGKVSQTRLSPEPVQE